MRKTKVLLLLHEMTRTGAPKIAIEVFDALRDSTEVRTIALEGGPFAERARSLGPLELLSDGRPLRKFRRIYYQKYLIKKRMRALRRWAPDLIYANSIASLPIARAVNLPDVPVILHVHEMRSINEVAMAEYPDLVTEWPTRYIAVSEAVVRDLESTCGIARDRISKIHEFLPEREFESVRRDPGGPGSPFVIGGCGDPGWRKGVTLWLLMAAEVRRLMGDSARFVWLGARSRLGETFRHEARLLGLDGIAEFVPPTPDPRSYFARFDVFAMTSWEDPCPLVVLENMRVGTPIISFAGGGGSVEVAGEAGVIVDEFCPYKMARQIAELASRPDWRARLGAAGIERARAMFTDQVQIPKIRREIDEVVSGRDRGGPVLAGRTNGKKSLSA